MPLANSGTALYAGSGDEFVGIAPTPALAILLAEQFRRRMGKEVETSELNSWRRSLAALGGMVDQAGIDTSGVGVELRLPWNSKRVDATLVARDSSGVPHVVLVELKQWSQAAPSPIPEMVIVGGTQKLHPSVQASLYADALRGAHSAFTERDYRLSPCAYLHDMGSAQATALRGPAYASIVKQAPLFAQDLPGKFGTFLHDRLVGGEGMTLLPDLVQGRYSPSRKLMDHLATALRGSRVWTLLDEQREAFNLVKWHAEQAIISHDKRVIIVSGGPGTGKSIIALHVLVALSEQVGMRVVHATGSKAFTTNLRALGGRKAAAVFRYFNNFMHKETEENAVEVLICDEAHRIRKTSNIRFTPKEKQSDMPQVEELIRAARVSLFLLDERQNVRADEMGTVAAIAETAERMGVAVERVTLDAQFRCNGCSAFVDWVGHLFSDSPAKAEEWRGTEYELRVCDKPAVMEKLIRDRAKNGVTGRLVAGYCWEWSDPLPNHDLVADVEIDRWKRPWNEKSPEQRRKPGSTPPPDKHPYYLWATQPKGLEEVGCIYSAQGFEFDFCGVILGPDLVWRAGRGWVAQRKESHDNAILRGGMDETRMRNVLSHTYRVLLTRGMLGTFLMSTDTETHEMLKRLVS